MLRGRGAGGALADLGWNLLAPKCSVTGGRKVRRVDAPSNGVRAVWIKEFERPIYLPEKFPIHCIQQVLTEETYPRNWHFYRTAETPVERNDLVFDCGAAEGLFTYLARHEGARAVAFEPHPLYFSALQRTFAGDAGVLLVQAAVGDQPGRGFLSRDDIASTINNDDGYPIEIEPIDAYCDRVKVVPTYLKADIEGFEAKMLAGAAETIARHHPKIAITTYHAENDPPALAAMLRRYWPKYRIRFKGIADWQGKPVMLHAW